MFSESFAIKRLHSSGCDDNCGDGSDGNGNSRSRSGRSHSSVRAVVLQAVSAVAVSRAANVVATAVIVPVVGSSCNSCSSCGSTGRRSNGNRSGSSCHVPTVRASRTASLKPRCLKHTPELLLGLNHTLEDRF